MQDISGRNIQLSITTSVLIASFLLLISTIVFSRPGNLLYLIGFSISTSLLATSLVQIIGQLTERIEKLSNQRRFLRLFGCDDKTNGYGSIAIIVPAFDLNRNSSQQTGKSLKQQAERLVSELNTKAAIKNDVNAASYLVSAFSKLGLPVPQIKWDEIPLNNDDGVKTYILIGLSNNLIESVKDSMERYFSITQRVDQNNNLSEILIKTGFFDNSNRLVEEKRWISNSVFLDPNTSRPRENVDYALFAKFRIKNKVFIICGGGTEWGTHDIGIHISNSGWKRVYSDLRKEKGARIKADEEFAVVFQLPMNREQSESISIVHKCIRKKKKIT